MSGIFAAAVCISALWLPWYMVYPSEFTADWRYFDVVQSFPPWLETAVMVFCGVTLFAFGWTAARWNWEKNWRDSLLAGGAMGLIAGCLIYDFIGAFHYGALGQKDVLAYFYVTVAETQGAAIIISSCFDGAAQLFQSFFVIIGSCTVVGAFGGLTSAVDVEDVWGSTPRMTEQWLFRVPAYILVISGYLCYLLASTFTDGTRSTADDMLNELNKLQVDPAGYLLFIRFHLLAAVAALFPLGITWGWIIRAWRHAKLWKYLYAIWIAGTASGAGWYFVYYFQMNWDMYSQDPKIQITFFEFILLTCAIGAGITLGIFSGTITPFDSKYKFSDWMGFLLAQGIIGGTQVFACLPAFVISFVVIVGQNINHLASGGLSSEPLVDQFNHLIQYLGIAAGSGIGFCIFGGIFVSAGVTIIRKFLKIRPRVPQPETPVFVE
jgi:hypothetical protein